MKKLLQNKLSLRHLGLLRGAKLTEPSRCGRKARRKSLARLPKPPQPPNKVREERKPKKPAKVVADSSGIPQPGVGKSVGNTPEKLGSYLWKQLGDKGAAEKLSFTFNNEDWR